ncbi:MAG: M48 family metallopeptidase [Bdellovibrionales bacterium]|nr:M48 family metallopeptidase [Bdellovibrionales bacterium]
MLFAALLTSVSFGCSSKAPLTPAEQHAAEEATAEWLRKTHGVVNDGAVQTYVNHLARQLSSTPPAVKLMHQHSGCPSCNAEGTVRIEVLAADEANAFWVGSSRLFITKGLILDLHSESEFAAVLAHELAHHWLGHLEQSWEYAAAEADSGAPHVAFSLAQELSADETSLEMLDAAGYDPRGALGAMLLAYRPDERERVVSDPDWRTERVAALVRLLENCYRNVPGVLNQRDFAQAQARLM